MNRFSDIANQAKAQHQEVVDAKAAEEAARKKQHEDRLEAQRGILIDTVKPIFEEARAGFMQSGLPATVRQEFDHFAQPSITLKIARMVDVQRKGFEVSAELRATVDTDDNRIRLSRKSWGSGPVKPVFVSRADGAEGMTPAIEQLVKDWFGIEQTFSGR